jgi:hypothetical protein
MTGYSYNVHHVTVKLTLHAQLKVERRYVPASPHGVTTQNTDSYAPAVLISVGTKTVRRDEKTNSSPAKTALCTDRRRTFKKTTDVQETKCNECITGWSCPQVPCTESCWKNVTAVGTQTGAP